jgi:anti-sigma regulatory factor (Ser/Thr protein kinase)
MGRVGATASRSPVATDPSVGLARAATVRVCADTADMNASDPLPAARSEVTSRHVRLAALPSAAPWARRVLRHALRERRLDKLSETALLLVSELVTNAVQASADQGAGDPGRLPMIALTVHITGTRLVTEVWDASPGVPALQEAALTGDGGRGLLLVDSLADAWGHRPAGHGKVVWCTVGIPG